jgi:hypothetical protein
LRKQEASGHGFSRAERATKQCWVLQAAEKLTRSLKKRQGTTSVVPQAEQTNGRASAPEGCFSGLLPNKQPFSAACEVVL